MKPFAAGGFPKNASIIVNIGSSKDDPAASRAQQKLDAMNAGRACAIGCVDRVNIFATQERISFGVNRFAFIMPGSGWQVYAGTWFIDAMRPTGCRAVIAS